MFDYKVSVYGRVIPGMEKELETLLASCVMAVAASIHSDCQKLLSQHRVSELPKEAEKDRYILSPMPEGVGYSPLPNDLNRYAGKIQIAVARYLQEGYISFMHRGLKREYRVVITQGNAIEGLFDAAEAWSKKS